MAKQSIYQREVDSLEQSKAFLKRNEYSKLELQLALHSSQHSS